MNLLLVDKGTHDIYVDILNHKGKQFKRITVNQLSAEKTDSPKTILVKLDQIKLGTKNIFLKIFDKHQDNKDPINIGTYRALTK